MPKLTDIPREIRDQIFEYCLLGDGEIMPYNEHYAVPKQHHAKSPNPSLLRVNKGIRAEAIEILYGKNTWRIGPSAPAIHRRLDSWYQSRQLWVYYNNLFRHVVVYFNQFDINPASAYTYARLKNKEPVETIPALRKDLFHNANQAFMAVTWAKKMYVFLVPSSKRLSFCKNTDSRISSTGCLCGK